MFVRLRPSPWLLHVLRDASRLTAAAAGAYVLLNLVGELLFAPFDTVPMWISLPRPRWLRGLAEAALGGVPLVHAWCGWRRKRWRRAAALVVGCFALVALSDACGVRAEAAAGRVELGSPVSASLLLTVALALLALDIAASHGTRGWSRGRVVRAVLATATMVAVLPALLFFTLGTSRYRRKADCAVVFGAGVWDDGRLSLALSDRVDEGVRLIRSGQVACLVMSGGRGANGWSEPERMRDHAVAAGVAEGVILLDPQGSTTVATARNVAAMLRAHGRDRVLLVSHYYHLPRARMLFERQGLRPSTVAATMSRRLLKEPWFLAREVVAFYHAWLFQ